VVGEASSIMKFPRCDGRTPDRHTYHGEPTRSPAKQATRGSAAPPCERGGVQGGIGDAVCGAGAQAGACGVDPALHPGVAGVLVFDRLDEAFEFVGVFGAVRFGGLRCLVLGDRLLLAMRLTGSPKHPIVLGQQIHHRVDETQLVIRLACSRWVAVVVADRLVTVSITCWVSNVAHEVIEHDVATAGHHGHLCYRVICGYRFTFPPALATMTSQPCPRCATILAAARHPQPTAGRVRRPGGGGSCAPATVAGQVPGGGHDPSWPRPRVVWHQIRSEPREQFAGDGRGATTVPTTRSPTASS
jgi:hypothetical protein